MEPAAWIKDGLFSSGFAVDFQEVEFATPWLATLTDHLICLAHPHLEII
ncbi:MAG: hypothetical protein AAF802_05065 [Planctomycetota bacterium]